jgi:hypothetical protein
MARRRDPSRERAKDYAEQAISLQRAAELLLQSEYPHPAHLLACHAAINAADAIVLLETGDTHGGEHRRSAEALLEADQSLTDLAKSLGVLSEEKNSIAYQVSLRSASRREAAVRESRQLVEEACHRLDLPVPAKVPPGSVKTVPDLESSIRSALDERRIDPQTDPWESLLVLLRLLSQLLGERTLGEVTEMLRKRTAAG